MSARHRLGSPDPAGPRSPFDERVPSVVTSVVGRSAEGRLTGTLTAYARVGSGSGVRVGGRRELPFARRGCPTALSAWRMSATASGAVARPAAVCEAQGPVGVRDRAYWARRRTTATAEKPALAASVQVAAAERAGQLGAGGSTTEPGCRTRCLTGSARRSGRHGLPLSLNEPIGGLTPFRWIPGWS